MAYFLSPALVRLRAEVNALWPGRSKASDGWIGDTSHAARKSDHNPDYSAAGIVRAIDVTNNGINVDAFISSVIRDARCRYVISRGRIWTRENGWQRYTGANAHNHHVHVSVRTGGGHDMQVHSWGLSTTVGNNLGGGGSVTVPNIPGAPAPISPEDDLTPEQDAALARVWQIAEALVAYQLDGKGRGYQADSRTLGVLPNKKNKDGSTATVLTTAEGQVLRDDIATAAARGIAETSAAYHQTIAALSGIKPGVAQVDVAALATALKADLPKAVVAELANALKG